MARSAYIELIDIIKKNGGEMYFERTGHPQGGAWIARIENKEATFYSNGKGFPKLDKLYIPKVNPPKHYRDYSFELIKDAEKKLLEYLKQIY